MRTWEFEDAKNRFSEVVRHALAHEPQRVTRGGRDAVVVVSAQDYERLVAQRDILEFLQESPLAEVLATDELDLERPRNTDREVPF